MSNETQHGHNGHEADRARSKSSFQSSFWFVIILVGLFIAALNFVNVMSKGEGEKGEAKTEAAATASEGEKEMSKADTAATKAAPAKDTAKAEEHK